MPTSQRTIRVFVSSTFRDMHAERDYLNRSVFPELRDRCRRRGADFVAVDLRWGVTKEEAENGQVLDICLDEIEQSRPFFVGLLGDRFGWVPPADVVATDVFERVAADPDLPAEDEARLARWYRLDTFSDPPMYRLVRERDNSIPDADADALVRLWITAGVPHAGESITAREILRGVFEEGFPPTHALFYLRRSGIHEAPGFPSQMVPVFAETDPDRQQRLGALRRRIERRRDDFVVREYPVTYAGLHIEPAQLPPDLSSEEQAALADGRIEAGEWPALSEAVRSAVERHGTVALGGLDEFGALVLEDLWAAIAVELPKDAPPADAHEVERAYHERFIAERTRLLVGRQAELDRMAAYLAGDSDQPLVVTGAPGSGKSAVLARLVEVARERFPDAVVIGHFVGASPGSQQLTSTTRSICETLRRAFGIEEPLPENPDDLRFLLPRYLEQVAGERPVILILDAINQLDPSDRSHELGWFPWRLPAGVKVVASTLPGAVLDRLRERVAAENVIEVRGLAPADARELAVAFLVERRKKLEGAQITALLETTARPGPALPLYLRVALEELCLYGDFWTLDKRIADLPATIGELFKQVLRRLEDDHTPDVAAAICGWIAASRSGLLESEVLGLLERRWQGFAPARWARFYYAIAPYLKPRGEAGEASGAEGLIDFYHDQLRFAVYERYLDLPAAPLDPEVPPYERPAAYNAPHRDLAAYYTARARQVDAAGKTTGWSAEAGRALAELPRHLTEGAEWDRLEAALCDLRFVEAKYMAGQAYALVADYQVALAALPELAEERQKDRERQAGLERYTRELVAYAKAWREARDRHAADPERNPLPQPEDIPLPEPPDTTEAQNEMRRTEEATAAGMDPYTADDRAGRLRAFATFVWGHGHVLSTDSAETVLVARNHASDGFVAKLAERIAERIKRIWVSRDPRLPAPPTRSVLVRTLVGHSEGVNSVAVTPDGLTAVSGGDDGTVRVWELATGRCLRTLMGHPSRVNSVAITPDGTTALSGALDGTLLAWDLRNGRCIGTLGQQTDGVNVVAITADGRTGISGQCDGTLLVWDLFKGQRIASLVGHVDWVRAVAVTPDGRLAVSGSGDKTLRLWDLDGDMCIGTFQFYGRFDAVAVAADGRTGVFLGDNSLWGWHLTDGRLSTTRHIGEGHSGALAMTPDGSTAVTQGFGDTLQVWDLRTGKSLRTLDDQPPFWSTIAITADGATAVTGAPDASVRVWNLSSGQRHRGLGDGLGRTFHIEAVTICPTARTAIALFGGDVAEFDLTTGRFGGWLDIQNVAQLSADGQSAVSCDDRTLQVWDLPSRNCVRVLTASGRVDAFATSSDHRHVVISYSEVDWKSAGHSFVANIGFHSLKIPLREAIPTGRQRFEICDLVNGTSVAAWWSRNKRVQTVAVAPDDQLVVVGNGDHTAQVLHLRSGQHVSTLAGHTAPVKAIAITPDGRWIVTASADGTLRVWNLRSAECRGPLQGHTDSVDSVAVVPDCRWVVSSGADSRLIVWDLASINSETVYPPLDRILAMSTVHASGGLVIGTAGGLIHILRLMNRRLGTTWATAARLWQVQYGKWEAATEITAACPWCGQRFPVPASQLAAIRALTAHLTPEQSPCLELPAEAWDEPRLFTDCPACHKPLRLNPFVVDNRDLV